MAQASSSVDSYGVHAVVANLLHTRKEQVWLVRKDSSTSEVRSITRDKSEAFIERQLIRELVALHRAYINRRQGT